MQTDIGLEFDRVVRTLTPFGELLVEWMMFGADFVSQRLKQLFEYLLTASARYHSQSCCQRNLLIRQFRSPLAPARHSSSQCTAHRHAEERREYVRSVVHILIESAALVLSPFSAHQADRIDIEQNRRRAALRRRFRIEKMGLTERQLERMHPLRILVKQVSQVRRRLVRSRDGQQHGWNYTGLYS